RPRLRTFLRLPAIGPARWQNILHAWVFMPNPDGRSEAVAEAEGFDRAASQSIAGPNRTITWRGTRKSLAHRKPYCSKPGASRARSIGGRIRVVKRFEMRRAEARCRLKPRLKPAPHSENGIPWRHG